MKKLFDKSEVTFAIVFIVIYVVGSSLMQRVSAMIGIQFLAEAVFNLILSIVLLVFILKNNLTEHLGLCKSEVKASKMLFYIPLFLVAFSRVLSGFAPQFDTVPLISRTVMMFGVGFLEEIIFRGFLFRGMAKDGLKSAVIVSAVTFGIGHIVNLLNGYDITKNIIQIVFAVAVGFLLVMIFVRTGSLIACIVFHALNNSCTGFASCDLLKNAVGENNAEWVLLGVCLVITALYFLYIWKFIPNKNALK